MVDGLERSYSLYIPQSYDGKEPMPLVLVFHGGGGNARNIAETTDFNQKADEEEFLVVYPQGMGKLQDHLLTWNAGFCCGYALENGIDDVSFIRHLIDHLQSQYPIDPSRIYATGISNGGMMTYLVGAQLSDIFAAIAPVAASIGGQAKEGDIIWAIPEPATPVSVLVVHGMNDSRVPYDGGRPTANDTKGAYTYVSVNESVAFWVEENKCIAFPERNVSTSGNIIIDTYYGGLNDTVVQLISIVDGTHSWPGGQKGWKNGDKPSQEIDATDMIWEFFEQHQKG